jgi:hypothetical protein
MYVVSEKWRHFWELPDTNLLGLFEIREKGLTICHTNEFVQSHFSDGNPNPISNPTPP